MRMVAGTRFGAAQRTAARAEQDASSIEASPWFGRLARAGLGSRTTIYLLLTLLCADIAVHGRSSAPADSNGALREVAHQPGGPLLLVVLAIGLFGYAFWRLVSALAPASRQKC